VGNSFGSDLGRNLQEVGVLWGDYQVGDMVRSLMGMMTPVGELFTCWHHWRPGWQKCGGSCGVLDVLVVPRVVLMMEVVLLMVPDLIVQMRVQAALARLWRDHRV